VILWHILARFDTLYVLNGHVLAGKKIQWNWLRFWGGLSTESGMEVYFNRLRGIIRMHQG
jgi:hypothetical protein